MSGMKAPRYAWQKQLAVRFKVYAALKAFGTVGYIAVFFFAYFWLLRHPMSTVQIMPLTVVDHWVRFSDTWLAVYLSLWVYVSLPPALVADRPGLVRYGVTAAILCATGLAVFVATGALDPDT